MNLLNTKKQSKKKTTQPVSSKQKSSKRVQVQQSRFQPQRRQPKVEINPIVRQKIDYWMSLARGNEIAGFGHVEFPEPDRIQVHDVYMIKQEGHGTANTLDADDMTVFWGKMYQEQGIQPHNLRFHWHTHPSMDCGKSAVDERAIDELFSTFDFMLTAIYNETTSIYTLDQFKPFRMRSQLETEVIDEFKDVPDAWTKEFEKNYTLKKVAYWPQRRYPQNNVWGHFTDVFTAPDDYQDAFEFVDPQTDNEALKDLDPLEVVELENNYDLIVESVQSGTMQLQDAVEFVEKNPQYKAIEEQYGELGEMLLGDS